MKIINLLDRDVRIVNESNLVIAEFNKAANPLEIHVQSQKPLSESEIFGIIPIICHSYSDKDIKNLPEFVDGSENYYIVDSYVRNVMGNRTDLISPANPVIKDGQVWAYREFVWYSDLYFYKVSKFILDYKKFIPKRTTLGVRIPMLEGDIIL